MIVAVVVLDQLTKFLVVANIPYGATMPFIGELLQLTYIHNTGASFSILEGNVTFLIVFSLVVLAILGYAWFTTARGDKFSGFCYALIIGGAIGNLIDRVRLGYVVDFLKWPNFPVFNIADCALVVGVILLAIGMIREIIMEKKAESVSEDN